MSAGVRFCMSIVAVVVVGRCLTIPVDAQGPVPTEIVIRIYDAFGLPAAEISTIRQIAGAILGSTHTRITWRECRPQNSRGEEGDTCADTLPPLEVVVRLVTGPSARGGPTVLGESLVDREIAKGTLSTVFADRVTTVARQVGLPRAVLLGRALAHEVGHLLLGTTTHTQTGLMRADWSAVALRSGTNQDWTFSPDQAARIGQALLARTALPTRLVAADTASQTHRAD